MKLESLKFKAGLKADAESLELSPATVLILVGPNNSGKSMALREIENWCLGQNHDRLLVDDLSVSFPQDVDEAIALLEKFKTDPPPGQYTSTGSLWIGQHTFRGGEVVHEQINLENVRSWVSQQSEQQLREVLLRLYTVRLDGRTRFTLSDPKPAGDLLQHPQNHLWSLFKDDESRVEVRRLTEEAFDMSFVVDPTGMKQFRIRMSERPPEDTQEEQALDKRARNFHKSAPLVSDLSDGVQAFTGLVSAVMSLPHRVILIDEPEAFLHPPLARRLGHNLARLSTDRSAHLVVATHSADFVMGCVESGADTAIVRLTYEDRVATARSLPPADVTSMMRKPLLRSTKALQGLFHRSVIVTEADSDRAFYDEINSRLNRDERGVEDALFVNAQNWQTIPSIISPLRSVGVPAAGILDIDTVVDVQPWRPIYESARIEGDQKAWFETERAHIRQALEGISSSDLKRRGFGAVPEEHRSRFRRFITKLAKYGYFVVPVGEVESWLMRLGVGSPKKTWLVRMFEALGTDPATREYIKPAARDVWGFLDRVGRWTSDPKRKGV